MIPENVFDFKADDLNQIEYFDDKMIIVKTPKRQPGGPVPIPVFYVYQFTVFRERNKTTNIPELSDQIRHQLVKVVELYPRSFSNQFNSMEFVKFERIALIKKDPQSHNFFKINQLQNFLTFQIDLKFDNRCDRRQTLSTNEANFIEFFLKITVEEFKKRKEDLCSVVESVRNVYKNVIIFRHDLPGIESFQAVFNSNDCIELFMGPALITDGNNEERSLNFMCLTPENQNLLQNGQKKYLIYILNDADLKIDFNSVSAAKNYFIDTNDNRAEENLS